MNTPQVDIVEKEENERIDEVYLIKEQNNLKIKITSTENITKSITLSEKENSTKTRTFYEIINFKNYIISKERKIRKD